MSGPEETEKLEPDPLRMELGYCRRCGALQVRPAGQPKLCPGCARALAQILPEVADEPADL